MSSLIEQARQSLREKKGLPEEANKVEGQLTQTFDRLVKVFDHCRHFALPDYANPFLEIIRVTLSDPDEEPIAVDIDNEFSELDGSERKAVYISVEGLESYLEIRKISGKVVGNIWDNETSTRANRNVNLEDLHAYNEVIDRVEQELTRMPVSAPQN